MVVMAPPALERPLTYDDLAAMPEDGRRYELINGELFELTGPTPKHQRTTFRLAKDLDEFVTVRELGEVYVAPLDVFLSPHNTVQPDVVFVSAARKSIVRGLKIEGAPDLLMEVLSRSTWRRDAITKAAIYATFGVLEYWLIDPERESIVVQATQNGVFVPVPSSDGVARSQLRPGFEVDPAKLFAERRWMQNTSA
jgi:Uma2 family endonuclease